MTEVYDIFDTAILNAFATWEMVVEDDKHYCVMSIYEPADTKETMIAADDVSSTAFNEVVIAFSKDMSFEDASDANDEFIGALVHDSSLMTFVVAFNVIETDWPNRGTIAFYGLNFKMFADVYRPKTLGEKLSRGYTIDELHVAFHHKAKGRLTRI